MHAFPLEMDQRRVYPRLRSGALLCMHQYQFCGFCRCTVHETQIGDTKPVLRQDLGNRRQRSRLITEEQVSAWCDDAVKAFYHGIQRHVGGMLADGDAILGADICTFAVVGGIGNDIIKLLLKIVCENIGFDHLRFYGIDTGILACKKDIVRLQIDHGQIDIEISCNQQSEDTTAAADIQEIAPWRKLCDEIVEKVCIGVEEKTVLLLIEIQA